MVNPDNMRYTLAANGERSLGIFSVVIMIGA